MNQPDIWEVVPNLPNVPERGVLAIVGDENNVLSVGTRFEHYSFVGGSWRMINNQRTFALVNSGVLFAGYTAATDTSGNYIEDGDGVYMSVDSGQSFAPYNEGWTAPHEIRDLATNVDVLAAATSEGVFRR